jgi:hypothetical protein
VTSLAQTTRYVHGDVDQEPALATTPREDAFGMMASASSFEDEPSLGSVEAGNQNHWSSGNSDEREGDGCADDREGDELQHGGDEHDGAEPDEADLEPLLGWTEQMAQGQGTWGSNGIEAEQGSTSPGDLRRGNATYGARDPHAYNNRDGMHVDAEQGFVRRKRLRNLSDRQKELVQPKLDRFGDVSLK